MAHVKAEVGKPPLSAAGGHRTAVRRFPTAGRSTTQGVDPAKLNPRIHCRGTHPAGANALRSPVAAASPDPATPAVFRHLQEVHGQVPVIRLQHTGHILRRQRRGVVAAGHGH